VFCPRVAPLRCYGGAAAGDGNRLGGGVGDHAGARPTHREGNVMRWEKVQPEVFMPGKKGRIELGIVATRNVDRLVNVMGRRCPLCAERFELGELVTTVMVGYMTEWAHERDIERQVMA
jgi:hypothetical protein